MSIGLGERVGSTGSRTFSLNKQETGQRQVVKQPPPSMHRAPLHLVPLTWQACALGPLLSCR